MRLGKLPEGVRLRAVRKVFEKQPVPERLMLPGVHLDGNILPVPKDENHCFILASGTDPDALAAACNRVYACAAVPESAQITIFIPQETEEGQLKTYTRSLLRRAGALSVRIGDVNVQTRAGLTNVLTTATVTAIGDLKCIRRLTGPHPGQYLIVAGYAGQAGVRSCFPDLPDNIKKRFRREYLKRSYGTESDTSAAAAAGVCREALQKGTAGISAMHAAGEGGIFAALWELTADRGVGFEADVHNIPVRQEALEAAQLAGLNPYEINSEGCLLIAADDAETIVSEIRGKGVPAGVLGKFTDTRDKILNNRGKIRFLDKPQEDLSVDFRYRLKGAEHGTQRTDPQGY